MMMPDNDNNVVETIRIEIKGDSTSAVGGVEKLVRTLERIKGVTGSANRGLSSVQKHLDAIAAASDHINGEAAQKITALADALNALNAVGKLKLSGKYAQTIKDIGEAVGGLAVVDYSNLIAFAGAAPGLAASLRELSKVKSDSLVSVSAVLPQLGEGIKSLASQLSAIRDEDLKRLEKFIALMEQLKGLRGIRIPKVPPAVTSVSIPEAPGLSGEEPQEPSTVTDTEPGRVWTERFRSITAAATKGMASVKQTVGNGLKSIGSKINNFSRRFLMRVLYRAMNVVISEIVTGFREGVNAVYQYSKALDGRLAKAMDRLATEHNYLKSSLGAMVSPLITAAAPFIEKIVDALVELLNVLNQIFARLSGSDTWTKAIKTATEYAAATDKATQANKKYQNTILGFDEINPLNGTADSAVSSAAEAASPYSFVDVPVNNKEVTDFLEKLKNALDIAKEIGMVIAAWKIGTGLADLLDFKGLDALKLAAGITLTVAGLTLMVDGMVDIMANGINWDNFLKTIGGGLALTTGGALLGSIFGSALIGGAIGAIAAGVGMLFIGVWSAINEGINGLNALLIAAGATLTGTAIGLLVGGPVGAAIGALIGLAAGLWTDLIITFVQGKDDMSHLFIEFGDIWWKGFDSIKQNAQEFFDWWKDKFDKLRGWWTDGFDTIANWYKEKIFDPIAKFAKNLWKGISDKASECWKKVKKFFAPAKKWFSELFDNISKTVSDVFYDIGVIASGCWQIISLAWTAAEEWFDKNVATPVKNVFTTLWDGLKNAGSSAWNGIKTTYDGVKTWFDNNVINPVKNKFSELWSGFKTNARNAWKGVKGIFSKVGTFFKNTFKDAWDKVMGVFSTKAKTFVTIKDAILDGFKSIVNDLIKGINNVVAKPFEGINSVIKTVKSTNVAGLTPFSDLKEITVPEIPLLAGGGMVSSGQMFIARESGAELVGNVGNRTAVMNNDQIVESVAAGVADANAQQNALLRQGIELLRRLLEKDNSPTVYVGTETMIEGMKRKNRRDGRTVVPVG